MLKNIKTIITYPRTFFLTCLKQQDTCFGLFKPVFGFQSEKFSYQNKKPKWFLVTNMSPVFFNGMATDGHLQKGGCSRGRPGSEVISRSVL